jgi:protease II
MAFVRTHYYPFGQRQTTTHKVVQSLLQIRRRIPIFSTTWRVPSRSNTSSSLISSSRRLVDCGTTHNNTKQRQRWRSFILITRQIHSSDTRNGKNSSSSNSDGTNDDDRYKSAAAAAAAAAAAIDAAAIDAAHASRTSKNGYDLAAILARERANFLSQLSFIHNRQQQNLYRQVYNEICQVSHKNQQHVMVPAEPGPTGDYVYRWIVLTTTARTATSNDDDDDSSRSREQRRRVYVRQRSLLSSSTLFPADEETEQVVETRIVVDDPMVMIHNDSMSLSVDETMIAYIVTTRRPCESPTAKHGDDDHEEVITCKNDSNQIMVRVIGGTQQQQQQQQQVLEIPTVTHENNNSSRIVAVEFGPKTLVHDTPETSSSSSSSSVTTSIHALYWVQNNAPDDPHRPSTVYTCNVILREVQHSSSCINDSNVETTTSSLTCSAPQIVYSANDDPTLHVQLQRTKGCRYMSINAQTLDSNEVYLIGAPTLGETCCPTSLLSTPPMLSTQLLLVRARQAGCMYHVDVGDDDDVFIVGNMSCTPFTAVWETCIDKLPIEGHENELNLVATTSNDSDYDDDDDDVGKRDGCDSFAIVDLDLFHDFYALYQVSTLDGSPRIQICSRTIPGQKWIVPLQQQDYQQESMAVVGPVAVVGPTGNLHYHAKSIRFFVDCPIQPRAFYAYNIVSHRLKQLSSRTTTTTTNQQNDYIQERVTVPSRDGTLVPLSLVYRKSEIIEKSGPKSASSSHDSNDNDDNPRMVILMGYGAYGKSVDISYSPGLQPLLDRGYVLAYAHTRGGGELGTQWHDQGRGPHGKPRGIEDYLACAKAIKTYLFTEEESSPSKTSDTTPLSCLPGHGHTQKQRRPARILAKTFSAGGVIVGGAVNSQPQLFDVVILTNAFVNVYETLMDPTLPLTQHEWDEYGNPYRSAAVAAAIQSYCPVASMPSTITAIEQQRERQDCEKNIAPWPRFLLIAALNDTQVPFYKNTLVYGNKLRKATRANVAIHIVPDGRHDLDHNREHAAAIEACFMIDVATATTTNHGS